MMRRGIAWSYGSLRSGQKNAPHRLGGHFLRYIYVRA
jgi:hypothetical protein